jgi:exopolyphosphatase/guanosine-5'-triphosphate,3'-diphosphate pyrophosphatase
VGAGAAQVTGPRAAIDVGSNTLLLTVVAADGTTLHDEARVVGLGKGLGDRGMFRPDRMVAAEQVLRAFVDTARGLGVDPWGIRAVATSGARRALNADTFFEKLQRETGLRVRIVSGDEEARLTWTGGLVDLPGVDGNLLVVDIGGGSTELVQGTRGAIRDRVSLEVGAVRLTERHLLVKGEVPDRYDPVAFADLEHHVSTEVGRVPVITRPDAVIGVAGTVTTLMAIALGLDTWDATRVHGAHLPLATLAQTQQMLLRADRAERLVLARVSPERADWLLAGATLLLATLRHAGAEVCVVSDRGLRYGLLC